jgi:hypothetical protein
MSFLATNNKGFRMKFENGFGISVQWGTENYCEKKSFSDIDPRKERFWESTSAEIAVFEDISDEKNIGSRMISVGKDDVVIGWLSTDDVAKVISIVQLAHPDNEEEMVEKIKELNFFI